MSQVYDPAINRVMLEQTLATAASKAAPAPLPGAEYAPSLFELLGAPPERGPQDTGVAGVAGDAVMPTFRSAVTELDTYRLAFLVAGVVIGRLLK